MAEGFFEVGKVYFDYPEHAFTAFETYGEFFCKMIFTNPDTGTVFAAGLRRLNASVPWEDDPVAYTQEHWDAGGWARTYTEELERKKKDNGSDA